MSGNENEGNKRKIEPHKKDTKTDDKNKESNETKDEKENCQIQANNVIYFKIINNEKEFDDYQNMNLENSFQPTYTYELFTNEIIHGYRGLKILISLTPKTFYIHLKIKFSQKLAINDNIEEIFSKHFKDRYTTDKNIFIEELKKEKDIKCPKGKLLYSENNREIYNIDILKDEFLVENYSIQILCSFFIDAASFIPVETNFWGYFLIIEKKSNSNDWHTLGFCSYKNFHIQLDKYYTMLSQFLVLPPYQRKGIGSCLLENIYKFLYQEDKSCLEVTTEDPDIEFILMRDYTICKIIMKEKFIDNLLKLFSGKTIENKDTYDKFNLEKKNIDEICKKIKLQENLITRAFEIIKYGLVANSKDTLALFEKDKKDSMVKMLSDSSFENINKKRYRGPFIFFHDEDFNYDYKKGLEEASALPSEKRMEMLYPEYIADIEKIVPKINSMILEYKNNLN